MKKTFFFLNFLIGTILSNAQSLSFEWAKRVGGTTNEFAYSIKADALGNIYSIGYFRGTVDFDPGPGIFNLSALNSNLDMYILKLDAFGNFVWAKSCAGIVVGINTVGKAMAIDALGYIYIIGDFNGTTDFDPGPGTFNLTTSGNEDVFFLKLNSSGNFVWAKKYGGSSSNDVSSLAVDLSGNIYSTGSFTGTVDFDPGTATFNLTGIGVSDVYISKLDSAGNFVWAKRMGGNGTEESNSIITDAIGNVYTTGDFSDTADFDPGASIFNLIAKSSSAYNIFVSKLSSSGNFIWAKSMGGITTDHSFSIAVDNNDNVYTTGSFSDTADFDPGSSTYNLVANGNNYIFLSKLNSSRNFVWARNIGGGAGDNQGKSIALDGSGNIYTMGIFQNTGDFDPGAGTFNLTSVGNYDIVISKLNSSGNFVWAISMGGTSYDYASSIITDGSDNIYATGNFESTVDFDPGTGTFNYTSAGGDDVFVQKLSQCTPPSATITANGTTTFCSGGSVTLNAPVAANRSYQWKKGSNIISGATLSSYTATTGGNYRVTVTNTATGCSKTTASATIVTVNALPSATITPQGPTTFCAGGNVVLKANTGTGLTYVWKKGGNNISGATASSYVATLGGTYKVEVTKSNGCSMTSAGTVVTVPCKEGEIISHENNLEFTVYPNPNSGEFTINFSNANTPIQIEITDQLGKIVKKFITNEETLLINESDLAQGIYCLVAQNQEEILIKKINITK